MSSAPPSPRNASAWEEEIRALEEANRAAFLAADFATLDRLWCDDFVVNSPLNLVNGKAQLFGLMRAGRVRHLSYQVEIERIQRHGDVVVVMGNDAVTDPPDGVVSRRRFTNIWIRDDAGWRALARHAHVVSREPAR